MEKVGRNIGGKQKNLVNGWTIYSYRYKKILTEQCSAVLWILHAADLELKIRKE